MASSAALPSVIAPISSRAPCRRFWSRRERIAATVILGVHGRKRSGPGETFWQYRPYSFGELDAAYRLAQIGALRPRVYSRE